MLAVAGIPTTPSCSRPRNRDQRKPPKPAAGSVLVVATHIGEQMSDQKTDGTTAARSREPVAEPYAVGISPLVKAELGKLHPDLERKVLDHLAKKG
jgi:hypothetical protein